jgi:hypothetical protein
LHFKTNGVSTGIKESLPIDVPKENPIMKITEEEEAVHPNPIDYEIDS